MTVLTQPEPGAVQGDRRSALLITGRSGAGLSTALKALEDLGYEAVDNLPLTLLRPLLAPGLNNTDRPLAVGIDSRTRGFSADALLAEVDEARSRGDLDARLVFITCDFEILLRRYTETRRRHPLAVDRPVADGIRAETVLLKPVQDAADLLIDTSLLTIHDLRRLLAGHFALGGTRELLVTVMSFAFAHGVPREADLVFDVRFLTNPHWDPELRPLTGLDARVQCAVEGDPDFMPFFEALTGLLRPLLPRYTAEGKSYLTVAVGCSGGRHRSVFIAERLAAWMRSLDTRVGVTHRELPQSG
jgi:UPF0042 nucleotide-binding protein